MRLARLAKPLTITTAATLAAQLVTPVQLQAASLVYQLSICLPTLVQIAIQAALHVVQEHHQLVSHVCPQSFCQAEPARAAMLNAQPVVVLLTQIVSHALEGRT